MSLLNKAKINEVTVDFTQYAILLRGEAKIGKSSLYRDIVQQFYKTPNAGLLIPFETGYKALAGVNIFPYTISPSTIIDGEERRGWEVFVELVDELVETAGDNGIKIIGIDTIDRFYDVAIAETIRQSRIQTQKACNSLNAAFGGYGKGKEFLFNLVKTQMQRLRNAGYGLFYIGHVKNKTIKDKIYQEEYQVLGSNLNEDMDAAIANDMDIIAMITQEREIKDNVVIGSKRYLRVRSDGYYACGSRFKNVPDKIELSADAFIEMFINAVKTESGITDDKQLEAKAEEQHSHILSENKAVQNSKIENKLDIINNIKNNIATFSTAKQNEFMIFVQDNKLDFKNPEKISDEMIIQMKDLFLK